MAELRGHSTPGIKIFLIGNKSDLEEKRQVSNEEGLKFAKDYNLDFFMETSAKLGKNTEKIFSEAGKLLYSEYLKYKNLYNSSYHSKSVFSSVDTKNSSYRFKLNKANKNLKESDEVLIKTTKGGEENSTCPC